jgi:hypothetical protein
MEWRPGKGYLAWATSTTKDEEEFLIAAGNNMLSKNVIQRSPRTGLQE